MSVNYLTLQNEAIDLLKERLSEVATHDGLTEIKSAHEKLFNALLMSLAHHVDANDLIEIAHTTVAVAYENYHPKKPSFDDAQKMALEDLQVLNSFVNERVGFSQKPIRLVKQTPQFLAAQATLEPIFGKERKESGAYPKYQVEEDTNRMTVHIDARDELTMHRLFTLFHRERVDARSDSNQRESSFSILLKEVEKLSPLKMQIKAILSEAAQITK